jgi:hypothetical protein
MRYDAGDLVEIIKEEMIIDSIHGKQFKRYRIPGIVLGGYRTSLYVMDRPYRSIDTVQYTVVAEGKKTYVYEEEIVGNISRVSL